MRAAAFVLVAVAWAAPGPAAAEPPRWMLGGRLGVNRATVEHSRPYGDASPRYGLNAGIALFIRLAPVLSFQTELAFSRKGDHVEDPDDEYDQVYSYIDVPLLLRVAPRWRVRPVGFGGGGIALLLDNEECHVGHDLDYCEEKDVENYDLAIIGGAGLEADLSPGVFSADVRYWHGLVDVKYGSAGHFRDRIRALTLSVGYSIAW